MKNMVPELQRNRENPVSGLKHFIKLGNGQVCVNDTCPSFFKLVLFRQKKWNFGEACSKIASFDCYFVKIYWRCICQDPSNFLSSLLSKWWNAHMESVKKCGCQNGKHSNPSNLPPQLIVA